MNMSKTVQLARVASVLIGTHWIDVVPGSGEIALECRLEEDNVNRHGVTLADMEGQPCLVTLHFQVLDSNRELIVRLTDVRALLLAPQHAEEAASSYGA